MKVFSPHYAMANEIWTMTTDRSYATEKFEEMSRTILFSLGPQYLLQSAKNCHVMTFVHVDGLLMGFAFLTVEKKANMPENFMHWSGDNLLNAHTVKLNKKNIEVLLGHITVIGCSVFAEKLGERLVKSQRSLAFAAGCSALAIEAVRPLDEIFYPNLNFQKASPKFHDFKDTKLVPMISKLGPQDLMEFEPCLLDYIRDHAVVTEDNEDLVPQESHVLMSRIQLFLWKMKDDNARAAEALRKIAVRMNLDPKEYAKLWSMRFNCSKYNDSEASRHPLEITQDWTAPKLYNEEELQEIRLMVADRGVDALLDSSVMNI